MKTVYLGLGSNQGDRLGFLSNALRRLAGERVVEVRRVSSVYETAPWGVTNQPDFLNLVAEVGTSLTPEALLDHCLAVEASLGRVRGERWGPRTIDVDLLWFEGQERETPRLSLPHPRMAERPFVLVPLAEIAPQLPVGGETAEGCARRTSTGASLRKFGTLAETGPSG